MRFFQSFQQLVLRGGVHFVRVIYKVQFVVALKRFRFGVFDKGGDVFDLDFFAVFVDEFHVGVIPIQHFFANGAGRAGVLAIYRARNQSEKILHGENVGRDHHISVRQIARVDIVFY